LKKKAIRLVTERGTLRNENAGRTAISLNTMATLAIWAV